MRVLLSALATAKLFTDAGLPPGVINVITTTRSGEICDAILGHPAVQHLTFTGSSAVGKVLGQRAGAMMKGMTMELGGHAPFVVFDDADIELAVADLLSRKFTNAGQTCSCPARMFLHEDIAKDFLERFAAGAEALIDTELFQCVINNLVVNAGQAMTDGPSAGEGKITVATRATGDRLELSVTDEGPGIPADVLPKIFEPLFSTKGFGVGVGLPTVKRIMEQHDGGFTVDSEPGKGTTVTVWLPIHRAQKAAA